MKCPGQDTRYWTAAAIFEVACPVCAAAVEFYKDDTTRSCPSCNHHFVNPKMDFGCAAYCRHAEQCIGTLPEEFTPSLDNLLKDKVAVAMKRLCRNDFRRIGFISRRAGHAEAIGRDEGVNLAVLLCAAYLKDIDAGPGDGEGREPAAILTELGASAEIGAEVCKLIELDAAGGSPDSNEARVLADADLLARMEDRHKKAPLAGDAVAELAETGMLTEAGRARARAVFRRLGVA